MNKSDKTYQCICGKTYTQQPNLARHHKTCEEYKESISLNANNNIKLIQQVELLTKELHAKNELCKIYEESSKALQQQVNILNGIINTLQNQNTNDKPPKPKQIDNTQEKVQLKKLNIDEYLIKSTPITFLEFMNNYIPCVEDCSTIKRYGVCEGTVKNILNYLSKYSKNNYPIIISNCQNVRMKLYVCNEQNKWTKICNSDAVDFLEKMVEKMINKLLGNMNKIYSEIYSGFNDPNHPKKEEYQNIKCSNIMMLRDSDTYTRKIVDKIKDAFRICDEQES